MNGADLLCDTLLDNGVDVCFANPGTSEMHFVAALDRKPRMRCVLGLFEGVVTGAADGFARMADKPAATLLHLGPGLANGLANLHNARRAHSPILNIVGDHATYHLKYDSPLTSDIETLARPMSAWVGRVPDTTSLAGKVEEAYRAALDAPGVATLILPGDAAWGDVSPAEAHAPAGRPPFRRTAPDALRRAAEALHRGPRSALLLGGKALRADALESAGRIAAATGAAIISGQVARWERGAGRVYPRRIPSYPLDAAFAMLKQFDTVILVGTHSPVVFFAHPGRPGSLLPDGCAVIELAGPQHDLGQVLAALADEVGASHVAPTGIVGMTARELAAPTGKLTADAISVAVARGLPEGAIICDETLTSAGRLADYAPAMAPHDWLPITGGAIGIGLPLATGAAIACPDRKVLTLQADGSGMYTLQALWTQARERLDIVTVVLSNRGYAILKSQMSSFGVNNYGRNAARMLEIDDPPLDWCALARGMGVEAARAETAEAFADVLQAGLSRRGPFLIEAVI